MNRPRPMSLVFATALLVLALDRCTKWLVETHLAGRPPIQVIPGVVDFTYATNTGGAFGILSGLPWLFGLATIGVSIAIIIGARKVSRPVAGVALGLILGGAIGNLIDRLGGGLSLDGTVTDFIDLHVWPVFNIADSAIVIGAILLAISTRRNAPESASDGA